VFPTNYGRICDVIRYKNFKCDAHNKFFEVNLYQKNPINRHHWRANLARPSTDIDLSLRQKAEKKRPDVGAKSDTSPLQPASVATGPNFHKATLQVDEVSENSCTISGKLLLIQKYRILIS
jgi:hypothetical protein